MAALTQAFLRENDATNLGLHRPGFSTPSITVVPPLLQDDESEIDRHKSDDMPEV